MKHRTWFHLGLKLIGVFLVVLGLREFVSTWLYGAAHASKEFGVEVDLATSPGYSLIGQCPLIAQVGFGLYLLFAGKWFLNKAIPSNKAYCVACGYDLSHSAGRWCSACGADVPSELLGEPSERTNALGDTT